MYICSWDKLWTRYKKIKSPTATSKEPGAKAGYPTVPGASLMAQW